ncbi:cation:dicarboxylate symporter family transporter [sulfur-oxidizing endosymbiont of Gigantopelta aegis]|uniref:cation:dicarboxylate symporter family transporter n=1 Tax=sulfur-oxidizing endosymbiont of Gigantopelta aegis TaxID=2794934 RepID=UPI0018DE98A0|nr:cation:dicarboxylase symporter family transporter [sulfur-oxidizing endosymbiont of Gigantopelta aegis]
MINSILSLSLSSRILISLFLGIVLGLFIGEHVLAIQWVGEVWIRLMQMTVLPYVVVSLISGVGSLDSQLAKNLAIRGGLLLLLFWLIAAIVIFAMPLTFPMWDDASFYSSNVIQDRMPFNPIEIYIPKNPFNAMANSTVPAVVLFCIAVGVALIGHKDKALLVDSFKVFTDVLAKVMSFMVQLTPIGVFAIVAVSAGTMTLEQLTHLEVYFVVYIVASMLLTFVILPLLIATLTPFSYKDILRHSRSALLTGFIAQNVFIILPMLIENSKAIFKKYQLDSEKNDHVVDVIIPVTFNFPNAGRLLALIFVPFAAWMSGAPLELSQYPEFLSTGIFSLFAKAQVALPFLLDLFHIPQDTFNYYIPSSIINGKFDTMVSVMNLFAFSLIVTIGLSGQLIFSRKKIIKNLFLTTLALLLSVLLTKAFLEQTVDYSYNKDHLIMSMNLPEKIPLVENVVYDKSRAMIDKPYVAETLDNQLLQRIKQRGVLRVGYHPKRIPFSYHNNTQHLVGMDVELFYHLAQELGVKLAFYPVSWQSYVAQLNQGEVDIIPGVYYETFNLMNTELTNPYIDGQLGLVVKDYKRQRLGDRQVLRKMPSLKLALLGEPVFIQRMSRTLQSFIPDTQLHIIPINSYDDFFAMTDEQVDGLVETVEIGSALTLLHPEYTIIIPKKSVLKFPMSFAIAKGEKDF